MNKFIHILLLWIISLPAFAQTLYIGDSCDNHTLKIEHNLLTNLYQVKEYNGSLLVFEGKASSIVNADSFANNISSLLKGSFTDPTVFIDTCTFYNLGNGNKTKVYISGRPMEGEIWRYQNYKLSTYAKKAKVFDLEDLKYYSSEVQFLNFSDKSFELELYTNENVSSIKTFNYSNKYNRTTPIKILLKASSKEDGVDELKQVKNKYLNVDELFYSKKEDRYYNLYHTLDKKSYFKIESSKHYDTIKRYRHINQLVYLAIIKRSKKKPTFINVFGISECYGKQVLVGAKTTFFKDSTDQWNSQYSTEHIHVGLDSTINYYFNEGNSGNNYCRFNYKYFENRPNQRFYHRANHKGLITYYPDSTAVLDTNVVDGSIKQININSKTAKITIRNGDANLAIANIPNEQNGKNQKQLAHELLKLELSQFYAQDPYYNSRTPKTIHSTLFMPFGKLESYKDSTHFTYQKKDNQKWNLDKMKMNSWNKTAGKSKIIKRASVCSVGLRASNGNWLIPPAYDNIKPVEVLNGCIAYEANVGKEFTLFDARGNVIIEPTKLKYQTIDISPFFQKKFEHIYKYGFILNDKAKDSFYIITFDNHIIRKGKGFLRRLHWERGYKLTSPLGEGFFGVNNEYIAPKYKKVYAHSNALVKLYTDKDNFLFSSTKDSLLSRDTFIQTEVYNLYKGNKNWAYYSLGKLSFKPVSYAINIVNSKKNRRLEINQNGKLGLLDKQLNILVPPLFDSIFQLFEFQLAYKNDSTFIYKNGSIFKARSTFHLVRQKNNGITKALSSYLVMRDGKYGLIDGSGKMLTELKYDDIGIIGNKTANIHGYEEGESPGYNTIVLVQNNKALAYSLDRAKLIPSSFTKRKAWFFKSVLSNQTFMISVAGDILVKEVFYDRKRYSKDWRQEMEQLVLYNSQNETIGITDLYGNWIKRYDQYKIVRPVGNLFYFQDSLGKCGVMDCLQHKIVETDYSRIYYDTKNQLLWYTDSSFKQQITNPKTYPMNGYKMANERTFWKLKNIKTNTTFQETFDNPVSFQSKSIELFSNNGYLGFINTYGEIVLKPEFDACFWLKEYNTYLLAKNNHFYTWNGKDKAIEQPYQCFSKIRSNFSESNSINHGAIKGDAFYFLDSALVNHYSMLNFDFEKIKNDQSYSNPKMEQVNVNYRHFERQFATTNSKADLIKRNIEFVANLSKHGTLELSSPSYVQCFPSSTFYSFFTFRSLRDNCNKKYNIAKPSNGLQKLSQLEVFNPPFHIISESTLTLSLKGEGYLWGKQYLNILIDTTKGIFKFNLKNMIKPNQIDSFTLFLQNKWNTLEGEHIPCINTNAILDLFNTKFSIRHQLIQIEYDLGNHNKISFNINSIASFLKEDWKNLLLN